ncbi:hypothetical protein KC19_4G138200 [Ceratodon purpureus]|uniref:Uncharacterized protein n=1 Tax=Ceratodon purpureus TaxID=3225 RepID=A0A8T0IAX8_CERPU|nr:hypothetical protein KC19_4G138200 [Ceratodon purpureus]
MLSLLSRSFSTVIKTASYLPVVSAFQLLSLLISEHEYQVVELHTICHELEASVYRASRTSTAGCCASLSTIDDLNLRV